MKWIKRMWGSVVPARLSSLWWSLTMKITIIYMCKIISSGKTWCKCHQLITWHHNMSRTLQVYLVLKIQRMNHHDRILNSLNIYNISTILQLVSELSVCRVTCQSTLHQTGRAKRSPEGGGPLIGHESDTGWQGRLLCSIELSACTPL